jgi:methionyl-tRNA formyltransferase
MTILGRLRVLFFGSGSPASVTALQVLVSGSSIVGVVVPRYRRRFQFRRRNPASPLIAVAREHGLKLYEIDRKQQQRLPNDVARDDIRPDLICVATFPYILQREVLELATRGGLNLHWSLLPKHRGPDPLFWAYFCDDSATGVTVHWLSETPDGGPILLQQAVPIQRGRPVIELYHELARIGGLLLAQAIQLVEEGRAPRISQDEAAATHEPNRAGRHVDPSTWPAERVWHFLRGLTIGRGSLLRDERGRTVDHGVPLGYEICQHGRRPGALERIDNRLRVFCGDGFVDVELARRFTWPRFFA